MLPMERPNLLFLLGLLVTATAAAGGQPGRSAGLPCDPSVFAAQVSLFCEPGMTTAQCCEPVVASVDLGGGVPCLCRVAAEPQVATAGLKNTQLLTLYTSCGGLRATAAHLATGCDGPSILVPTTPAAAAAPASSAAIAVAPATSAAIAVAPAAEAPASLGASSIKMPPVPSTCDPDVLTRKIVNDCSDMKLPTASCCEAIITSVDIRGCLCALDGAFAISSTFSASLVLNMYPACGGLRAVGDSVTEACGARANNPPPSRTPPAIADNKSFLTGHDERFLFGLELAQSFELALGFLVGVYQMRRMWRKRQGEAQAGA